MKKRFLETGRIVTTHGIKGEVKVEPWCDSPEMLCALDTLYFRNGEQPVLVENARVQKNMVVMKLAGVDTMEQAQAMRGKVLYLDREDLELDDGVYFIQDLIGLRVKDADTGEEYGVVKDVTQTGANDVYHVAAPDGKLLLFPAIPDVVIKTDLEGGEILIRPLEGLFDL